MISPPQSPDLNPIELLWDKLDRRIRQTPASFLENLWRQLQDAWKSISLETLKKLINRMPRLVQAVLKAKGGYFDESAI